MLVSVEIYKNEDMLTLCCGDYIFEVHELAQEILTNYEIAEKMLFLSPEHLTIGEPEGKLIFVQQFYVEDLGKEELDYE